MEIETGTLSFVALDDAVHATGDTRVKTQAKRAAILGVRQPHISEMRTGGRSVSTDRVLQFAALYAAVLELPGIQLTAITSNDPANESVVTVTLLGAAESGSSQG